MSSAGSQFGERTLGDGAVEVLKAEASPQGGGRVREREAEFIRISGVHNLGLWCTAQVVT